MIIRLITGGRGIEHTEGMKEVIRGTGLSLKVFLLLWSESAFQHLLASSIIMHATVGVQDMWRQLLDAFK